MRSVVNCSTGLPAEREALTRAKNGVVKVTGEQHKKQYKLVLAGAGAAAVVAMGAFGAVLGQTPALGAEPGGEIGETVTETTAPSELETSVATPPVEVELPDGYGMG
ncbi:hypothetical protein [Mycolicibacterium sp. XJ870]